MGLKRFSIEERIEILEEFARQYPALWVNKTTAVGEFEELENAYLKFVSTQDENDKKLYDKLLKGISTKYRLAIQKNDEVVELKRQLEFCIKSYKYIYIRSIKGKLSEEVQDKIIKARIGGIFGSEYEIIRVKYKISKNILQRIVARYGSIDDFRKIYIEYIIKMYTGQECETPYLEGISKHLVNGFDFASEDLIFRSVGAAKVYEDLFGSNYCIIDSENMDKKIEICIGDWNERNIEIFDEYYGLHGKESKSFEYLGEKFGISAYRAQQIRNTGLRRLGKAKNIVFLNSVDQKANMSKEDIEIFIRMFFERHDIFYNFESFELESDDRRQLLEVCKDFIREKKIADTQIKLEQKKKVKEKQKETQREELKEQSIEKLLNMITIYQIGIDIDTINILPNITVAEWLRTEHVDMTDVNIAEVNSKVKMLQEKIKKEVENNLIEEKIDLYTQNIQSLDISKRAKTTLIRAGIKTVDELTRLTKQQLLNVEQLGRKTFIELIKKLHSMGLYFADETSEVVEKDAVDIRFICDVNVVREKVLEEMQEIISIEMLGLSTRPYKSLKRAKINTIQSLMEISYETLKGLRGIGEQCVCEILQKVHLLGYRFEWELESENEKLESAIENLKDRYVELNRKIKELEEVIEKIEQSIKSRTRNLNREEAKKMLEKMRTECLKLIEEREKVANKMEIMGISRD